MTDETRRVLLPRGEALVANSATVLGRVRLGARVSVWYSAVVRGDSDAISLGELTNVQDGAVIHADTGVPNDIGAWVTIGHGAVVHGRRVGDRCLIGIGAVVLGGAEIGDECIVAAGAVVREGAVIPPRSLVAGVPAKRLREVTPEEAAAFVSHAEHYWELAQGHQPPGWS
ncbi:MAG: gamma carbonic anhydrase family protein [Planctomycetota bacterium]|nr:MAG: gamma carbonic anhydrase family protein [Planctomycetota bacterium]